MSKCLQHVGHTDIKLFSACFGFVHAFLSMPVYNVVCHSNIKSQAVFCSVLIQESLCAPASVGCVSTESVDISHMQDIITS